METEKKRRKCEKNIFVYFTYQKLKYIYKYYMNDMKLIAYNIYPVSKLEKLLGILYKIKLKTNNIKIFLWITYLFYTFQSRVNLLIKVIFFSGKIRM